MVARCPRLQPFISTNDKTPFTDGHIDVYRRPGRAKEDWWGRVPVQVKGRTLTTRGRAQPVHSISRTDLIAYQRDSGVLYFYVTVDRSSGDSTPYYRLLSPFVINSLLREVPGSAAKIRVAMWPLTDDLEHLERLLELALKTRDQRLSLGFDRSLLKNAKNVTLYSAHEIDLTAPVVVTPDVMDFALVLNTNDGLSVPLDGELQLFPWPLELQFKSGDYSYEASSFERVGEVEFDLWLSPGLRLSFGFEDSRSLTRVHLTLERSLSDRLKSLGFFMALMDTKILTIGSDDVHLGLAQDESIPWLRSHLKHLKWLAELFVALGVDPNLIEPDEIDEGQLGQLFALHQALVLGEELADSSAVTSRVLQKVGPWHVMFMLSPGSSSGLWRCVDPFVPEERQQFLWTADGGGTEESIPVTAYDLVEDEYLGTVLNMRLEEIVGAYEAISDISSTFGLANQRVLALIRAADSLESRSAELLNAAALLNDWLLGVETGVTRHMINGWQIDARRYGLTSSQRIEIRRLKREVARSEEEGWREAEVACAVLLESHDEVEHLLAGLEPDTLERMMTWPIWNLRAGALHKGVRRRT